MHSFVHFFAVVLIDYDVKLPSYKFYGLNVACILVRLFFFSLPLIFTLAAASISHFLTAAITFSCLSSNETLLFCFLSFALRFIWTASVTDRRLSCLSIVLVVNVRFDTGLHVGGLPFFRTHDAPLSKTVGKEGQCMQLNTDKGKEMIIDLKKKTSSALLLSTRRN